MRAEETTQKSKAMSGFIFLELFFFNACLALRKRFAKSTGYDYLCST
jgi:hypothetical protein